MIKHLPNDRVWLEVKCNAEEYEAIIIAMSKVGAPDFSAFVSYLIAWEKARKTGNPAPPMPWKEDNLTLLPVTNAPIQPRAMPYSPARRYDEGDTGNRNRLRQMIAMKRQIELELIHFAETELLRC